MRAKSKFRSVFRNKSHDNTLSGICTVAAITINPRALRRYTSMVSERISLSVNGPIGLADMTTTSSVTQKFGSSG